MVSVSIGGRLGGQADGETWRQTVWDRGEAAGLFSPGHDARQEPRFSQAHSAHGLEDFRGLFKFESLLPRPRPELFCFMSVSHFRL